MMDQLTLITVGFLSTLISIIFFRPLAIKIKLIDYPDSRKQHIGQIPLIGGLSIFTGILVYFVFIDDVSYMVETILISSFLVLLLGIYDDLINMKPKIKLFFQLFLVTVTIYFSGIKIENLGFFLGLPYALDLSLLSIPFTIISTVGLMNAFNMIDGLDGQAGSLSAIAIIGIFVFGFGELGSDLYNILLIILSGLLAFLIFNLAPINKMKIFLGDGGSLFLGFIIAFSLIYCSQIIKLFSPSFALWCVAIPLFDFFSVVTLRKIKKQSLITANSDHIHNFLQNFNLSRKLVAFLTSFFGLAFLMLGYFLELKFPTLSFWIFIIIFTIYLSIRFYYLIKIKNI